MPVISDDISEVEFNKRHKKALKDAEPSGKKVKMKKKKPKKVKSKKKKKKQVTGYYVADGKIKTLYEDHWSVK